MALEGLAAPAGTAPDGDVARGRDVGEQDTDSHVELDAVAAVCAAYADERPVCDGFIATNPSLDIPGDQDDNISVLTSCTVVSAGSENDSEACLPDILQDDDSITTRRTTNCSFRSYLASRSRSLGARPSGKLDQGGPFAACNDLPERLIDDSLPTRRTANCSFRSNLVTRSRSLDFVASKYLSGRLVDDFMPTQPTSQVQTASADEHPHEKLDSNSLTSIIPSLATTIAQSVDELHLPPPIPPPPASNTPSLTSAGTQNHQRPHLPRPILPLPVRDPEEGTEETLYTAVAEAQVSADCGSARSAKERSLFIKQGRCPACGIQTYKTSGVFKTRSPLSNEQVLAGRCLICNPISVVTYRTIEANASPFDAESNAKNETVTNEYLNKGGQHSSLHAHEDAQVLERETEPKECPVSHSLDHSRKTPSVPSLLISKDKDGHPNCRDLTPSAPFLDKVRSESVPGDAQLEHNAERRNPPSKAEPHDEVERWLLSHIPTLKRQDIESYCRCLDEDGFDSILTLNVLEEGDLSFMKPAHRRVLMNGLRSRRCEKPCGEVERWLLSHLPTLKQRDMERYCRCLDEGGFDSILMLGALEEEDLSFMKPAHRRVLTNGLQSRTDSNLFFC